MYYIYLLRNKVTNRVYVGRTKHKELRFRQHINALSGSRHPNELMQEDFNLYGKESFEYEIVGEQENLRDESIEEKFIWKNKSYDKRYGYNYKDPIIWSNSGKFSKKYLERTKKCQMN